MIKEDYVSFETAKHLKEKGFDEGCSFVVNVISKGVMPVSWPTTNSEIEDGEADLITLPTLQMAMKWLRKVHNVLLVVDYEWECDTTPYFFKIYRLGENGEPERIAVKGVSYDIDGNPIKHIICYRDWEKSYGDYSTYEDACEAAIKYCLENLI